MNTEISHFVLPTAPVKTLWFEFLFTEGLLESHLETKHCDPSAIELIIQFLSHVQSILNSPSSGTQTPIHLSQLGNTSPINNGQSGMELDNRENVSEGLNQNQPESEAERKAFHLKLLALKVTAYLNWNLDILEAKLPLTMQHMLVEELMKRCKGTICETFSTILYHRWLVRSLIKSTIPIRNNGYKTAMIPNMPAIDPMFIPFDILNNLTMKLHKEAEISINQLCDIALSLKSDYDLSKVQSVKVPSVSSWKVKPIGLNSDGSKNYYDWNLCSEINAKKLLSEIRYELGKFYFIRDLNFAKSCQLFELIPINERNEFENLNGYIVASKNMAIIGTIGMDIDTFDTIESSDPIKFFQSCLKSIIEGKCVDTKCIERKLSTEEIAKELNQCYKSTKSSEQKKCLTLFSSYLSCRIPGLRNLVLTSSKFDQEDDSPQSPPSHGHNGIMDIDTMDTDTSNLNEEQLIESTEPEVILDLSAKVTKEYHQLNRSFFVPRLLVSLSQAISNPILSNKCLLVLAKANHLRKAQFLIEARTLYLSVLEEVQALVPAFYDLLSAEILHTDLELNLSSNDVDERRTAELLSKCINVLRNERTLQELSPDLMELSCVYLLDNSHPALKDYANYNPNQLIRFASLLYLTSKSGSSMKYCKDFWDALTIALLSDPTTEVNQKKMKMALNPNLVPGGTLNVITLSSLITRIKSQALITIIASALIRMHNLVKDSASAIEISPLVLPVQLSWPAAVATTSIMPPLETIYGVLIALINEVSKSNPNDVTWIKVKGELAFIRNENKDSMKYFIEMLSILTGYFTTFTNSVEEEECIKKLILTCSRLNCHTSSAILQQMVQAPNYALAFKSLGERSCFDSSDHLYDCIWDVNLLEYLVNLHTKRGDMERKLKASQLIGQLELNANNSKEILTEAANVKKKTFFRILAKKYM